MQTRRDFIGATIAAALAATTAAAATEPAGGATGQAAADKAEDPRITRARLAGPQQVTKDATVAIMAADGTMSILAKGTNEWVCVPGDENRIGSPPMCMNPMGMQWMMDAMRAWAYSL